MTPLPLARRALLAAAAASVLVTAGCSDPPPTPSLEGQVHLTLLHTADIHSRLFPYNLELTQINAGLGLGADKQIVNVGGAARLSYVIGRERARAERVLHLDCGDYFDGAPIFNYFSGEPEVRTMSAIGPDASLVANHEFDRGAQNLGIQLQKWANYPALAANYDFSEAGYPGASLLSGVVKPFTVLDVKGLKVAVIGMANLSSLGSVYTTPNRLGILPLDTTETAQFYVDLLRPMVDLVVIISHLGLDYDEPMIQTTSGIDIVLGSHNHIVLQPPKSLQDCQYSETRPDGTTRNFILLDGPNSGQKGLGCMKDADCGTDGFCYAGPVGNIANTESGGNSGNAEALANGQAICKTKRTCNPRNVVLAHSGAFAQFLGRLDLIVSNSAADLSPTYDPLDGFEVINTDYTLFPINDQTPVDPVVTQLLEPYAQHLDATVNLDLLVGYAPSGAKRSSASAGDSALGNIVATAMQTRLGIQTDFSLTNTTGIRTDLVPGPVTLDQMFNIFPFDNAIVKMQLSGYEVQELFDYTARRSTSRGCVSQVQISGARVVMDCGQVGPFDEAMGQPGVATHIYVGPYLDPKGKPVPCISDADCPDKLPNQCDPPVMSADGVPQGGYCYLPIQPTNSYELATSDYLAAGGSGFITLQYNTARLNTRVLQRDALIDYVRSGAPCGAAPDGSLYTCSTDADCGTHGLVGTYVCACSGAVFEPAANTTQCTTASMGCGGAGHCVLQQCRDDVATFNRQTCLDAPNAAIQATCETAISPCASAGEMCKFLACVDQGLGNYVDGRVEMVSQ